ncbi:hypothetical protein D3871_25115 [Noviherbaspirillum saxi]|uniref:Uncharacterized protein n=1 Tax=Noviherbaspirillum saxi TaxID=2320863 RepID=A0A3A3FFC6_9BURK|nr:hypothetical protein D3871_25115 [Noviherbaspirillum saxi]
MFAYATPPKPAPTLRARGMRLRLHVGPNAFGNALGNSIVDGIGRGSQQESELTTFRQSEIRERNATEPGAMPFIGSVVFKGGSNYAAKQIEMDEFLSNVDSDPMGRTESQGAYNDASLADLGGSGGVIRSLPPKPR